MRHLPTRRQGAFLLRAGAAIVSALLAAAALAWGVRTQEPQRSTDPASASQVAVSLAQGAAWIWPGSNGPAGTPARYREAAVLVESLLVRANRIEYRSRTEPLALPPGVRLLPVVHVEAAADAPSEISVAQREAIVTALRRHVRTAEAGAGVIQLDFEAPARMRASYIGLVAAARQAIPSEVRLSVTALAHWCTQGDWLDQLPADEVVPMLYRLGPQAAHWRSLFARQDASLARSCRGAALGFATNDRPPPHLLAATRRPYWFDESAWSNPSRPPGHLLP